VQKPWGKHQEPLPPSGKFFTKSSITVSESASKFLQSCIQSAAQGTSGNKKVAQILFQEQKASLLAKNAAGGLMSSQTALASGDPRGG